MALINALLKPAVGRSPGVPAGRPGGLARPVANPGRSGQNMRYALTGLQRGDRGYTDGVYWYDENGLSLDRPDSPIAGLPGADESERWNVWNDPGLAVASGPTQVPRPPARPVATRPTGLGLAQGMIGDSPPQAQDGWLAALLGGQSSALTDFLKGLLGRVPAQGNRSHRPA